MEDRVRHLRKAPLFCALSDEDIRRVADLLKESSHRRSSTVYRQGESDTNFYIVVTGQLRVWVRDEQGQAITLNYLQDGDSFGQHSILTGERRDVTIEAQEDTRLLRLEKRDLDTLVAQYPHLRKAIWSHRLDQLTKVPLFEKLPTQDLHHIAAVIGQAHYREGDVICQQGGRDTAFYIIESGRVAVLSRDEMGREEIVTHLQAGDVFGESSLLTSRPRDSTVQALEDTNLFYLNKRDFDKLRRDHASVAKALTSEAEARQLMLTQHFPWQREGEVLVALSYKHIYSFVRRLWLLVLPILTLAGVLAVALAINWTGLSLYAVCAVIGMSVIAVVVWLFLDWRNDYFVVTNKRVVHVDKTILLRETREEAPLGSIQDVAVSTPGIVARAVGFDDLTIQTAGASGRLVFSTLPNAVQVRDRIFQQVERTEVGDRAEKREAIRRSLGVELGQREEESLRVPEPGPISPVIEPNEMGLLDRVRKSLGSLMPKMRIEENGVVTWRKHWFRLLEKIVGPLLLMFILLQLGLAPPLRLLSLDSRSGSCFVAALVTGLFVGSFLLWYRYEDWRNDIYQLTDERIIDIERLPLGLREERREASLAMIQDIRYEIPGIVANLLDYGNVVIETAAREAVFTFDWVHQPRRVQQDIFARMEALREKAKQQERERRTSELVDWFAAYTDLSNEQGGSSEQDER